MEQMKIIGWVRTDFPEKFGAPRQSGLVRELTGRIEFAPEYRNKEAFRGLDEYSHIWVLWQFSENIRKDGRLHTFRNNRSVLSLLPAAF